MFILNKIELSMVNLMKLWPILMALALLTPLNSVAAIDGEALFGSNCSTCHRKGGRGSIGLPLNKAKFKYFSDDYLAHTIRLGRPGRIMPAFNALSDAQVDAIIRYLRVWSNISSVVDESFRAKGSSKKGGQRFKEHCVNCHGEAGKGLGKGTGQTYSRERDFKVIPPAISNPGFLASASDDMLRGIITHGIKDTVMLAYKKSAHAQQDIEDIIVYLRKLQGELAKSSKLPSMVSEKPTIFVDSPYDYATTVDNLKQALAGYNFLIFPDRYIEMGLFPEWEVNKKQITIRYCSFNKLFDLLKIDPRLGIGLPCRITVIEREDGQVQLVAMNMNLIAHLFNNAQLEEYAKEMSGRQKEILEEAIF